MLEFEKQHFCVLKNDLLGPERFMENTLLIVDDERNILNSLARLFEEDDYTIYKADGGSEGLEILAEHSEIGVILTDQRMPEMTGVQFLTQARELAPDALRIVLSGYTELNSITSAINEGAVYKFLTKPWDDDLLRDNIKNAFMAFSLNSENTRLSNELEGKNAELETLNASLQHKADSSEKESHISQNVLRISQTILNKISAGIVGLDNEHTVVYMNEFADDILPDLFLGESIFDCESKIITRLYQQTIDTRSSTSGKDEENLKIQVEYVGSKDSELGVIIMLSKKR